MNGIKKAALFLLLVTIPFALWARGETESTAVTTATAEEVGPYYNEANPLSDLRVRKAIAYAIDMDTLAETVLEDAVIVADSNIPNGPWKVSGLEKYSYDPDRARQLLKDANWDPNRELDLVFYYGDQTTIDLMTAIQSYLADVGVKMSFRKLEGDVAGQLNTLPADPVAGPSGVAYDLGYGARAALALQEYYNYFKTGQNPRVPGNAEVDTLVDAINGTSDVAKQRDAFFEIEEFMSENLPSLPLYYQQLFIYESTRVNRNGGIYGNEQYNYDWGIVDWTVEPDSDGNKVLYTNTGPIEFFQNPWFNPGIFMPSKVLWSRLVTADGGLTPTEGQLAESFNLSSDGMTLAFTIRDGITWHDGSPFTVEDVKWSVELASQIPTVHPVFKKTFSSLKGFAAYTDGSAAGISGISIDGNKITFEFEVLEPNVLLTFSQWAPLPKKYLDGIDPLKFQQHQYWQSPIGSGPYKVEEVEMNDFLVMVPFENYYEGVAKIDQIVCYPSFENDPNLIKNAVGKRLDYGFTKNVADVKALQAMDHMRVVPADIPYTRILWFNMFPRE
jgi:peptide/nickel transport system substrate-binding protein